MKRMARSPMVTRRISTTEATLFCVNTDTGETYTMKATLPREYKSDKDILKYCAKNGIETESVKVVKVIESHVRKPMYKMTEQKFIDSADIIED